MWVRSPPSAPSRLFFPACFPYCQPACLSCSFVLAPFSCFCLSLFPSRIHETSHVISTPQGDRKFPCTISRVHTWPCRQAEGTPGLPVAKCVFLRVDISCPCQTVTVLPCTILRKSVISLSHPCVESRRITVSFRIYSPDRRPVPYTSHRAGYG